MAHSNCCGVTPSPAFSPTGFLSNAISTPALRLTELSGAYGTGTAYDHNEIEYKYMINDYPPALRQHVLAEIEGDAVDISRKRDILSDKGSQETMINTGIGLAVAALFLL